MLREQRYLYAVTYTHYREQPVSGYATELACVLDDRAHAFFVYASTCGSADVRSVCLWRLTEKGSRLLHQQWVENQLADWWITCAGDYEACLAHEIPLELRVRGEQSFQGTGTSVKWQELTGMVAAWLEELGIDKRTLGSSAESAGYGQSEEQQSVQFG